MIRKFGVLFSCAAPLALLASPAMAQGQAATSPAASAGTVAVGTTIYDASGAEVGTIKSVAAPNFVIDTGTNTATLELSALGTGPKGPILGLTKAELDAAAQKAAGEASAALASAIVIGAPVHASDGTTPLGKIAEVADADFVLDTGKTKVKLPKSSLAQGSSGLMIGMSPQEFTDATASAARATAGK